MALRRQGTRVRYGAMLVGTEDIERLRRSIALLTPGQPAGLSREEAVALVADLRWSRQETDRLMTGLRQLSDGG